MEGRRKQSRGCFATCEKGDSEVKGASIGDCGAQWPEDAMLAGLGTDESGERGGKRGLKRSCVQFGTFFGHLNYSYVFKIGFNTCFQDHSGQMRRCGALQVQAPTM